MIGSLRGTVIDHLTPGEVVIDVGGVGYRVLVPPSVIAGLSGSPGQVLVHVHTHVRDDAIVLYGFAHPDERRCFEALIGAHGVGPSLALAILSALSPASLSTAVLEDDVETLCLVPGVGKKTAARLLLELKARLDLPVLDGGSGSGTVASPRGEAQAALMELGYAPDEVRGVLDSMDGGEPVEDLVRSALRELARSR